MPHGRPAPSKRISARAALAAVISPKLGRAFTIAVANAADCDLGALAGDTAPVPSLLNVLHGRVTPDRFAYFRHVLARRFGGGLPGCGCWTSAAVGFLAEEFTALGCRVTGVDPSPTSIGAARAHAAGERRIRLLRVSRIVEGQGSKHDGCLAPVVRVIRKSLARHPTAVDDLQGPGPPRALSSA